MVALALLLTRLYGPLTALSNVRVDVMSALVCFERVFEVLDLAPAIAEKPDARRCRPAPPRSSSATCDFRYPSADEVSLASLEDVAVAGPHASPTRCCTASPSRSSPARWSRSSAPPAPASPPSRCSSRGSTTSPPAPCSSAASTSATPPCDSLRDTIGVVTQDAHLFHETIAREPALRQARRHRRRAPARPCARAQVGDLVARLPDGLDTVVGERGYRLSGGEKQRIAIARLLLKAPSIVILDEATAHLDSESEAAVQRALAEALAGRTALVIAHRLSTVRDADQILVVDEGRIVEHGTHDSLVTSGGLYAELYRTQFAVVDSPLPHTAAFPPDPLPTPLP